MRIREQQLFAELSTDDWELRLGTQFRSMRIAAGFDQAALAELADVSVGAVRNLERGNGSTLKTVVRVTRALRREDWLAALSPVVTVSPLDLVRSGRTTRTRVYRPRSPRG
jgi:transcriptional regulator with XRE-family HTH domain